jgi:putative endonuclease
VSRRTYYVYILTNAKRTVLYTGVTSDLVARVARHKRAEGSQFAGRYNVDRLVYYESGGDIQSMIAREKQIKAGSRAKKIALIEGTNPDWRDLFDDLA